MAASPPRNGPQGREEHPSSLPLQPVRSSVLAGTGSCVPRRVLKNVDFPATLHTSDEWIRTRTGICERRLTNADENSFTLGLEASRRALAAAGLTAPEIDLIVCATVTPLTMCPSNACRFQGALGCRPIPAFDVIGACTGFIHATCIADQFIRAGSCQNVLVVGTEVLSRTLDYSDRGSCILFGDAAGAMVLRASDETGRGIRWSKMYSDGTRGELIRMPSQVTNTRPALSQEAPLEPPLHYLTINGREVYRFAVRAFVGLVQEALEACPVPEGRRFVIVPHQVNQRIIDAALQELPLRPEQIMLNLDRYGNTSAASIPLALDEALREGRLLPGDQLLLAAFGGGLTWGGIVIGL
jgi:3-oxoacyl-[acyl-carrier-protein] synthase-3